MLVKQNNYSLKLDGRLWEPKSRSVNAEAIYKNSLKNILCHCQIALKMKKMESDPNPCFSLFLLIILPTLFAAAAAAAVSGCPVNFEFANYTIITSKCKGPEYPANLCCSALAEFACPYAKYLNDLSNDCASTMFSYINLYGKYPSGLFSTLCSNGSNGLQCPTSSPILDTCHVQRVSISHVHPL
ncbi:GPI-anchored protein LLG2-like [Momordica charantia]|uniref:GPI-anchored protein LLG2-like n=1 Tax=Momordica charantia TaxID=3673 RepID=A0A6J1CCM2_MOMCH|nr:GPI-anchored protein LLG2-like [Momordica charantia]